MTKSTKLRKPPRLPPPKYLDADAAAIWREVVAHLAGLGTLSTVDSGSIEMYSTSLVRLRRLNEALAAAPLMDAAGKPHPLLRTIEATANTVRNAAHVLGLNPGARRRMPKAKTQEAGVWGGVLD